MAENGADGKGGESAGSEFVSHGLWSERETLFGDAQEPLVHDDIAAERAAAE